jgi:orotidine-5'-phosphate decarboxylase
MTQPAPAGSASTRKRSRFQQQYEAAARRNDSLLCVGLDPDPERMPPGVSTREFLLGIIEATADVASCYKPNIAFFEQDLGAGYELLREIIAAVPEEIPVLLDAKRGDIGHTAAAYARAVYDGLGAGAVTLNPYLGLDAVEPFLAYEDRHAFLLCRTSNPGAADLQDLPVGEHANPLYEWVAALANQWNERGNVGLVVGATYPQEAARIREICPELLILMPGVGAQQGELEAAVRAGVDARGGGLIVNASRAVLYAGQSSGGSSLDAWTGAARRAAQSLRDAINAARGA